MGVAPAHARGQPRIAPLDRAQEHREAALRQVAAGELCARGPGGRAHAEGRSETVHRVLGQAAVGGDLAPEHRQQPRRLLPVLRWEEDTSELQSLAYLVFRLLLEQTKLTHG